MSVPFSAADTESGMGRLATVQGRSLWDDALRRLVRNRAAVVSIATLGIIAVAAIFGPFFLAYPYDYIDYSVVSCAPDWWPARPRGSYRTPRRTARPAAVAATASCCA